MKIEVLISTMFLTDVYSLLEKLNIQTSAIIINQCEYEKEEIINYKGNNVIVCSTRERGISKSRNYALKKATGDVLVIADDDFRFEDSYDKLINDCYINNQNAEGIIFEIKYKNGKDYRHFPQGRLRKRYKYSVNSTRITIKRSVVVEKNLRFDEKFGSGSEINCGEDTIFISDCFRKKIIFYSVDNVLCREIINDRESTWFKGYDELFFINKGKVYRRLTPFYLTLIFYYAVKHKKDYSDYTSFFKAIKLMLIGARKYKKEN